MKLRPLLAFLCVGIAFLILFLPYIAFVRIEQKVKGIPSEEEIVNKLAGLALRELYGEEVS
jgi:hypothetical protein